MKLCEEEERPSRTAWSDATFLLLASPQRRSEACADQCTEREAATTGHLQELVYRNKGSRLLGSKKSSEGYLQREREVALAEKSEQLAKLGTNNTRRIG